MASQIPGDPVTPGQRSPTLLFKSVAMAVAMPEKTPIVAERPLGPSAGDTTPPSPSRDSLNDDADKKLDALGYTPVRTQNYPRAADDTTLTASGPGLPARVLDMVQLQLCHEHLGRLRHADVDVDIRPPSWWCRCHHVELGDWGRGRLGSGGQHRRDLIGISELRSHVLHVEVPGPRRPGALSVLDIRYGARFRWDGVQL